MVAQGAHYAVNGQRRGFRVGQQRFAAQAHFKTAKGSTGFEVMHVLFAARVGNQGHQGAVKPQPGQGQGGGNVGVFWIQPCRLAGAALKNHRGFADAVQIANLLGRGVLPGPGRFAPGVADRIQPANLGCRQGVNAADGARQQLDIGLATLGRRFQALHQADFGQRPHRDNQARDATLQRWQHMLFDGAVAGALDQQVGARIGRQCVQHPGWLLEPRQTLAHQIFGTA